MADEQIETGEQLPAEGAEETVTPPVETDEVEETPGDEPAAPPKPKGVQKRLDELTREKYDERRRADRLEAMLEQVLAQKQPVKETEPEVFHPTRPQPTLADCDYDTERYVQEAVKWDREQMQAQYRQQHEQQQKAQQSAAFEQTFQEKNDSMWGAGLEKYPDFEESIVSIPATVMHKQLAAAVLSTEAPADVAYYLSKNPAEASRISKLSYADMRYELGRLESKAIVPPPPRKTTAAPPPVNPVGSNAAAGAEPDSTKDPEAWAKWEAERARKRGKPY